MSPAELAFWTALILLFYVYAGYPLLMAAAAAVRPPPPVPVDADPDPWPTVTVIVSAYNEAARIGPRLENLLALDYPRGRLNVMVGSDGSTDQTAECARGFCDRGVQVYAFAFRRGKPSMLNNLVPRASGRIVVLADARQQFAPNAVKALVKRFADPGIGAVSGELVLTQPDSPTAVARGVGAYWRYETIIRRAESRFDSMVGVTGAIYAIRRERFVPIPEDTILDDVLIPMHVVRAGYRVVMEGGAVAVDQAAHDGGEELARKSRTLAGSFQLFARHAWLLNPATNRLWMQTLSHKGLRLLGPFLLAVLLSTSVALAQSPFYAAATTAQLVFYLSAVAGAFARQRQWRVLGVPYTFCVLNLAALVAFWRFAVTGQQVMWERKQPGAPRRASH